MGIVKAGIGGWSWREIGKRMRQGLLTPHVVIPFAFVLLQPFWMWPAVYFCMWLLCVPPVGWWPWALLVSLVGLAVWSFVDMFRKANKAGKPLREARKALKAGDAGAQVRLDEARALFRANRPRVQMWWFAAMTLAIPTIVPLILWSDMTGRTYPHRIKGKVVFFTPEQELRVKLRIMQREGINRIFWR